MSFKERVDLSTKLNRKPNWSKYDKLQDLKMHTFSTLNMFLFFPVQKTDSNSICPIITMVGNAIDWKQLTNLWHNVNKQVSQINKCKTIFYLKQTSNLYPFSFSSFFSYLLRNYQQQAFTYSRLFKNASCN
jgi:hypothetical protein